MSDHSRKFIGRYPDFSVSPMANGSRRMRSTHVARSRCEAWRFIAHAMIQVANLNGGMSNMSRVYVDLVRQAKAASIGETDVASIRSGMLLAMVDEVDS